MGVPAPRLPAPRVYLRHRRHDRHTELRPEAYESQGHEIQLVEPQFNGFHFAPSSPNATQKP
jgi:hypothetical protein